MKNSYTDSELVSMLTSNGGQQRTQAFTLVVKKYQQRLYWHIRKMVMSHDDADDILQNTFIKAWNNLDQFRGDAQLLTWLYRIATNETMDFFNSSYAKHSADTEDLEHSADVVLDTDPFFDGEAAEKKLQQAIASLPPKQRMVFNMRYYDEMPYAEMAAILDTSEGALKASYHHAAKKIENFMQTVE